MLPHGFVVFAPDAGEGRLNLLLKAGDWGGQVSLQSFNNISRWISVDFLFHVYNEDLPFFP